MMSFLNVFRDIVSKCKKHLINIGKQGKIEELKGLNLSDLNDLGSCLYNKNGTPSVLYVKVPTDFSGNVIPEFYEKDEIDGPDEDSEAIDPFGYKEQACMVNAAVKFESIFIKGDISLQVKLYEAEMTFTNKRLKNVKRKRLLTTGK